MPSMPEDDESSSTTNSPFDGEGETIENFAPTPGSSLSFQETMVDLANWWCMKILQQHDVRQFDELDTLLEFLAPVEIGSPLGTRLHCLMVWQELLNQTESTADASNVNELEDKDFDSVQDKFILLYKDFFLSDESTRMEYQDVLRMIRVHGELVHLYKVLNHAEYSKEEMHEKLDESMQKGRDEIYFGEHSVPESLKQLVNKGNGWDAQTRRRHILNIVYDNDSELSYIELRKKMRLLLLYWCENKIDDGLPELVDKEYRGVARCTVREGINVVDAVNPSTSTNGKCERNFNDKRSKEMRSRHGVFDESDHGPEDAVIGNDEMEDMQHYPQVDGIRRMHSQSPILNPVQTEDPLLPGAFISNLDSHDRSTIQNRKERLRRSSASDRDGWSNLIKNTETYQLFDTAIRGRKRGRYRRDMNFRHNLWTENHDGDNADVNTAPSSIKGRKRDRRRVLSEGARQRLETENFNFDSKSNDLKPYSIQGRKRGRHRVYRES